MKTASTRPPGGHYLELLLAKRGELLRDLRLKSPGLAESGAVADDDKAPVLHEQFIALHMKSLDYEKLKSIDAALDRLTTGDYGLCLACGEEISPKRLEAIPWAQYCIVCQEQARSGEDLPPHERAA